MHKYNKHLKNAYNMYIINRERARKRERKREILTFDPKIFK